MNLVGIVRQLIMVGRLEKLIINLVRRLEITKAIQSTHKDNVFQTLFLHANSTNKRWTYKIKTH